jgi:hypothetical protein
MAALGEEPEGEDDPIWTPLREENPISSTPSCGSWSSLIIVRKDIDPRFVDVSEFRSISRKL